VAALCTVPGPRARIRQLRAGAAKLGDDLSASSVIVCRATTAPEGLPVARELRGARQLRGPGHFEAFTLEAVGQSFESVRIGVY
jgi:hypothetical protein